MNDQTATMPQLPPPLPELPPEHTDGPDRSRNNSWRRTPVARDPEHRRLGGVVAGLAAAYGFDLRTTRIAVAIATVVLPVIAVVYGAAWLMLPARPEDAMPLEDVVRERRRRPILIALAIVVIAAGLGSFGSWFLVGTLPWGVGLIALGVLLWAAPELFSSHRSDTTTPTTTTPTTTPTTSDATVGAHVVGASATPPPPRRSVRRRPVGAVSVLIAFGTMAVMAAGDALGWWTSTILAMFVTALLILAFGLVLAGFINRRWAVVPGVIALGSVASFLLVVQPNLDGGTGQRTVRPTTTSAAAHVERLAAGQLVIDLTAMPSIVTPLTIDAQVGFGQLHVIVPAGVSLQLDTEVGAGRVALDGREIAAGLRSHTLWIDGPTTAASGEATIILDLEVGAGEIAIDHAAGLGTSTTP